MDNSIPSAVKLNTRNTPASASMQYNVLNSKEVVIFLITQRHNYPRDYKIHPFSSSGELFRSSHKAAASSGIHFMPLKRHPNVSWMPQKSRWLTLHLHLDIMESVELQVSLRNQPKSCRSYRLHVIHSMSATNAVHDNEWLCGCLLHIPNFQFKRGN